MLELWCRKYKKDITIEDLNLHSCLNKRIHERNNIPIFCPSLINKDSGRPLYKDYYEGKIPLNKTYEFEKDLLCLEKRKRKVPLRPSVGMPLITIDLHLHVEGKKEKT